jgi:hypothetical protein
MKAGRSTTSTPNPDGSGLAILLEVVAGVIWS